MIFCYKINDKCSGCAMCVEACPRQAIAEDRPPPFQVNKERCVECGVCAEECPLRAIERVPCQKVSRL
jgi:Pyruvate/2-oxoacid:ferredoxin oxidoreductase delta subunit